MSSSWSFIQPASLSAKEFTQPDMAVDASEQDRFICTPLIQKIAMHIGGIGPTRFVPAKT